MSKLTVRLLGRRWAIALIVAIFALAVIAVIWLAVSPKTESEKIVGAAGVHMMLPQGEDPELATVTDVAKLKDKALYRDALPGDKVLFYRSAHKAIVYRPSADRIVAVGVLATDAASVNSLGLSITIVVNPRYETQAVDVKRRIADALPSAKVIVAVGSRDYPQTIVVDPSSKDQPLAEQVADVLDLPPGKLPLGEVGYATNIVIFVGEQNQ